MIRFTALFLALLFFLSGCLPGDVSQRPGSMPAQSPPTAPPPVVTATPVRAAPDASGEATRATPSAPSPSVVPTQGNSNGSRWIAVIGLDGNVWLFDSAGGQKKQVTKDGTPQPGLSTTTARTTYCCFSWSSDGKLLAFRGRGPDANPGGVEWHPGIWVYNIELGEAKELVQNVWATALSFRPGTHLLAFDQALDPGYFISGSGKPDPNKAKGIMSLDADTGQSGVLVKPEKGLWLNEPVWSPDGSILGFVEQTVFENPTPFALYDFRNKSYRQWNQVIGDYAFSPDGKQIAYDRLINANGSERIWISDLSGKGERVVSIRAGMLAYGPAWSPQGDLLAYKIGDVRKGHPAYGENTLYIQPGMGGQARKLAQFDGMGPLSWSSDGTRIAFWSGTDDQPSIKVVTIADGSIIDLGKGYDPAWQP